MNAQRLHVFKINACFLYYLINVESQIAILKILCSCFGITDQQISFSRSNFSSQMCREKLAWKFGSLPAEELQKIPTILAAKEREFSAIIQHSPPSDILMSFETLLPFVGNFPSDTKVFHGNYISC